MTRVHVWGASGYAAAEAIRWLDAHPFVDVGILESRSHAGQPVAEHFPLLRTAPYRFSATGSVTTALRPGDIVIAAGGHGEAREFAPAMLAAGARVIDLSADFRFDDGAAYGLCEWNAGRIRDAAVVANPGCYPTAALLAILPLAPARGGVAGAGTLLRTIVDAKSGITGAGRNPSVGALFAEVAGDIRAYGLDGHRHQPEIERIFAQHAIVAPLTFTPHVVPIARGMLVDAYCVFEQPPDAEAVRASYRDAYAGSAFVRVLASGQTPSVAAVIGTNDAELRVDVQGSLVRIICAIDNLGKGAAGQAIQNLNIMLGYPEETGLHARAACA
ncbi:MAG: N-acetyl-gamma-glutamyl-phosphate reductase [Vulcanimicrobiaceae bacterium]